jgi:hypothetical protein
MDHDLGKSQALRRVIADKVRSDPEQYNEAVLEKSNEEYYRWILDRQKWGGAIDLAILADHYRREIAAYDIQTKRCDIYGQVWIPHWHHLRTGVNIVLAYPFRTLVLELVRTFRYIRRSKANLRT